MLKRVLKEWSRVQSATASSIPPTSLCQAHLARPATTNITLPASTSGSSPAEMLLVPCAVQFSKLHILLVMLNASSILRKSSLCRGVESEKWQSQRDQRLVFRSLLPAVSLILSHSSSDQGLQEGQGTQDQAFRAGPGGFQAVSEHLGLPSREHEKPLHQASSP